MSEDYTVTSMEFKGEDSVGHYNYLLSFNKSLVHTGNLSKIEEGLNDKTNLQDLKEKVEKMYNLADERYGNETIDEHRIQYSRQIDCYKTILELIEKYE